MKILVSSLLFFPLAAAASAQTYPHPLHSNGSIVRGPSVVPLTSGGSSSLVQTFQVVDALPHQDDFWSNMLVADANHNGRQEIVIHYAPVPNGPKKIVFFEDDGSGHFVRVHTIDLDDGGVLAIGDVDGDGLTDLFFERALGSCNHQYVRWESSSPNGFPDHKVWSAQKEGNVVDFRGTLADTDGDGLQELVVGDDNFTCTATSLKIFESAPNDQMTLIFNTTISTPGADLGNPIVADFDLDGRKEIVVAEFAASQLLTFEAIADNTFVEALPISHTLFNAYQLASIERYSPDGRPMLFLAGQHGSADYRVQVYEMTTDNTLTQVNEVQVPALCGASIPQIYAADLFGTRRPEIVLDRLCDPVPVYTIGPGGSMTLFDTPMITESLEVIATRKTALHSGALAIGTFPTNSNPLGKTLILELQ